MVSVSWLGRCDFATRDREVAGLNPGGGYPWERYSHKFSPLTQASLSTRYQTVHYLSGKISNFKAL